MAALPSAKSFPGLDGQEQALVLGYAVPMPVVVQARRYDDVFIRAIAQASDEVQEAG